jgi:sulfur carrier protein
MRIVLNGKEETVQDGITVLDLLTRIRIDPSVKGIAVAVNAEVVSREDWTTAALSEGDQMEVIHAVQGG